MFEVVKSDIITTVYQLISPYKYSTWVREVKYPNKKTYKCAMEKFHDHYLLFDWSDDDNIMYWEIPVDELEQ